MTYKELSGKYEKLHKNFQELAQRYNVIRGGVIELSEMSIWEFMKWKRKFKKDKKENGRTGQTDMAKPN